MWEASIFEGVSSPGDFHCVCAWKTSNALFCLWIFTKVEQPVNSVPVSAVIVSELSRYSIHNIFFKKWLQGYVRYIQSKAFRMLCSHCYSFFYGSSADFQALLVHARISYGSCELMASGLGGSFRLSVREVVLAMYFMCTSIVHGVLCRYLRVIGYI